MPGEPDRVSLTPSRSRREGTPRCEEVAGWIASVYTSPRLGALTHSSASSRTGTPPPDRPPAQLPASPLPPRARTRPAPRCPRGHAGLPSRPGGFRARDGSPSPPSGAREARRDLARVLALAGHAQRQGLEAPVGRPRLERRQHSPTSFRTCSTAPSYGASVATTPAVRSPWPERYLVALWTTMSAPQLQGTLQVRRPEVLSTTRAEPGETVRVISATATSATRKRGLEMLSITTARGFKFGPSSRPPPGRRRPRSAPPPRPGRRSGPGASPWSRRVAPPPGPSSRSPAPPP